VDGCHRCFMVCRDGELAENNCIVVGDVF